MIGGGIGAGLGLGLLRAALSPLAGRVAGIQFAMYFWWAWLLGAALALGMALAEPLLLDRPGQNGKSPPVWPAPLHPDRLPVVLAAGLGALFFGLAHIIVAWFNGLSLAEAPLMVPLGFVAGLGLSLALYNQPRAGWPQHAGPWLLRLGIASLIFVLTQTIFILARNQGPGLAVAWGNSLYEADFSRYGVAWWQQLIHAFPHWFDYMALFDASLVGLVLAVSNSAPVEPAAGNVGKAALGRESLPAGLNIMTKQKVNTVEPDASVIGVVVGSESSQVHIGRQQHYGDEVGGDKTTVGSVSGSTGVAIGRGSEATVQQGLMGEDIAKLFATVYQHIQTRPEDPNVDKPELIELIRKIEQEAAKGEAANPTKLERWLKTVALMAPDIWEVTVASLAHPLAGVATVIRKVVEKAQAEAKPS
jgi:hypothetical protein